MIFRTLILSTFFFTSLTTFAQKEFIDSLVNSRFTPEMSMMVSFFTPDVLMERPEQISLEPMSEKRLQQMLDSLDKFPSKELESRLGSAYNRLGLIHEAMFHKRNALDAYQKALKQQPLDEDLLNGLIYLQMELGDLQASLVTLETLHDHYPNDTNYYSLKFYLQLFSGQVLEANGTAQLQLSTFPDLPDPYLQLTIAESYRIIQQMQYSNGLDPSDLRMDLPQLKTIEEKYMDRSDMKAVYLASKLLNFFFVRLDTILESAAESKDFTFPLTEPDREELNGYLTLLDDIRADPNFHNAYFTEYVTGTIRFMQNQREKAAKHFKSAIEELNYWNSDQDNPSAAFDNLLLIYLLNEDLNSAIELIKKRITLSSVNAPSALDQILLGQLYASTKDYESATAAWEKALRMNPEAGDVYALKAEMQILKGDNDKAQELLDQLFQKNANNEELYYALTILSLATGNEDSADFLADKILSSYPEDSFAISVKGHLKQ